ncbi:MAG: molybdopterin-dependent oxidoreductase [Thermoflexales bacterium]|nr:molybdopterin-dependent oxidoreductase [Thermoflexales bacterium]
MTAIGQSLPRVDALGKVTGHTLFPGDLSMPGQVYMKVLFARRPHARVKSINVTRARQAPGVLAVLTAKDVPLNEFGLIQFDAPVLVGPGRRNSREGFDVVRHVGEKVALVVAETEKQAQAALELIRVRYEDLPAITDPRDAMRPSAEPLHPGVDSNILSHVSIRRGDTAEAFRKADVVVEGTYRTPAQEHAYLQPEAGLAYIDEQGRLTVEVAGQWTHEDRDQIAHALKLDKERVRVIYPAIGGAFGGREDMSVQIILALAAWKLKRPVKIVWSREESIIGHHKRHPMYIRARWGASFAGELVAAQVEIISDAGAYAYTSTKVLNNAALLCTGVYKIPHVKVDAYAVYTNNIPCGAFRGFGGPQAAFAAEQQMNKLAEKLGMDPVELRAKNLLHEKALLSVGTPLPPGVSIGEVVEQAAQAAGWQASPDGWKRPAAPSTLCKNKRYGIGFACAFKNVGFSFGAPEQCTATVELHGKRDEVELAIIYHSGAECGQGAHTAIVQMAAEALDMPLSQIQLVASDTAHTPPSGSASASRMTFMAGNAIMGAVEVALFKWYNGARPASGSYQYLPPTTTSFAPKTGHCEPNFAYGYVAEAAEVEVDVESGRVRLLNVWCADDVGQAINPQQVRGQIEGAVVQAQGYAILENFITKEGRVLTPHLSSYLIPTVLDVPQAIHSIIVESPDPRGPYGARGMGEMPFLPLAPAITAAVHDATGVWFDELPLTPDRVLAALKRRPLAA